MGTESCGMDSVSSWWILAWFRHLIQLGCYNCLLLSLTPIYLKYILQWHCKHSKVTRHSISKGNWPFADTYSCNKNEVNMWLRNNLFVVPIGTGFWWPFLEHACFDAECNEDITPLSGSVNLLQAPDVSIKYSRANYKGDDIIIRYIYVNEMIRPWNARYCAPRL